MARHLLIDTTQKLHDFIDRTGHAGRLGIDTEFMREKTYYPKLCLVQLATEDQIACIDPLAIPDLSELWDWITDPSMLKVLHSGRQDLEVVFQASGRILAPVFDTQIAAALCGHGDQVGYANLVQERLGIELDKSMTRTDWSRRPLPQEALDYAAEDVRHLFTLQDQLVETLDQRGRLGWLEPEFDALLDESNYRVDTSCAWRRVKGSQRLKPRQLARLAAMADWRETEAMRLDRPRQWLVKDDALVFMAQRPPKSVDDIAKVRSVDDKTAQRHGEAILKAIESGENAEPPSDSGSMKTRLTAAEDAQLDLLMAVLKKTAAEIELSSASLSSRKELEKLVRGERDTPVLKGWRKAAVGDLLLDVLEGKVALRAGIDGLLVE